MVRVKRGLHAHKRRKKLLKQAKGFRWGRKSKYRLAKDALYHAWRYSYRDRKTRKRERRKLWQVQINAAARPLGFSYSQFIHKLRVKNIALDRKILVRLAQEHPAIFKEIADMVK